MKASTVLSFILGAAAGAAYVMYRNCKSSCCCKESECDEDYKAEEEKETQE